MTPREEFKSELKMVLDDMARVVSDYRVYGNESPMYKQSNKIFDQNMNTFIEKWAPKDD